MMDYRKFSVASLIVCSMLFSQGCAEEKLGGDWIPLFNGENLEGWKGVEDTDAFYAKNGMIIGDGYRSHLFYVGDAMDHSFKNFIFRIDVRSNHQANSGVFFHTRFEDSPSPSWGYEVQINNSHPREKIRTGSLYGVKNLYSTEMEDGKWFTMEITVRDKNVQVRLDGELVLDYTEAEDYKPPKNRPNRRLSEGTFALQNHDPLSKVQFKNIYVKPLRD